MTALRVRVLLLAFATGALLGQSCTAHAASDVWFPNVCRDLRNGMPLTALETVLTTQGYTSWDAGQFTGQEILQHCPDMKPVVLGEIR